ncbi:NAD(P)-dependent dehydrogenase, short-chain alcohol dehydrogenase family [Shimia gijangensis]|uniref:NAD(P)-dependent dehydrogenase, short-chain alcohol dehydrogenase family n=1 Tax=Shimia gijangensis TaxID=1470563 RepID=A0A1M6T6A7_9RHOB|nr:SDR family NAD(P)-dependent oxidoreductase [Shimia gijangensis]SHK52582.1 NAD(P)-dependent dehydrogenase, short-chain alcohol dehydrogenase family [Shimia gijangensis]
MSNSPETPDIRFDGRVAIVTGAGTGLGRSHAMALAARGALVVVNDLGGGPDAPESAVEQVATEIRALGGQALSHGANVTDADQVQDMVNVALEKWGRIDILVNNAGILRDKSFSKMTLDEFRQVLDVHVFGSVVCTKMVWDHMKKAGYGRIVMTSSSSGIYGNFGQTNYGTAKMGLIGFMNVLHLEGQKYGVHVNSLAPTAATQMTEGLLSEASLSLMSTESVSAGLLYLVSEQAPSRLILCAGAGGYAASKIYETEGVYLTPDQQTPEQVAAHVEAITDPADQAPFEQGFEQTMKFVSKAAEHAGIDLKGSLV